MQQIYSTRQNANLDDTRECHVCQQQYLVWQLRWSVVPQSLWDQRKALGWSLVHLAKPGLLWQVPLSALATAPRGPPHSAGCLAPLRVSLCLWLAQLCCWVLLWRLPVPLHFIGPSLVHRINRTQMHMEECSEQCCQQAMPGRGSISPGVVAEAAGGVEAAAALVEGATVLLLVSKGVLVAGAAGVTGSCALVEGTAVLVLGATVLVLVLGRAGVLGTAMLDCTVVDGADVLAAGAAVDPSGAALLDCTVVDGADVLAAGADVLASGAVLLDAGADVLASGAVLLDAGAAVLAAGSCVGAEAAHCTVA